jgi:hypothetical protein
MCVPMQAIEQLQSVLDTADVECAALRKQLLDAHSARAALEANIQTIKAGQLCAALRCV